VHGLKGLLVAVAAADREGAAVVEDLGQLQQQLVAVGRLDINTEGLLLLTNDGELGNRLLHPKYAIEKEYLAEVDGVPTDRQIARIRRGVELDDGVAKPTSARLVAASGARGAVRLTMTEGRKREVRRLLMEVGLPVTRLVRLRVGPVKLGDLAPGALRELSPEEIQALARATGM